ncbi:MAG: glycosyltransferase [Aliifodinibius sp.]|nr:glycosyltransferase family 4 protein [Fodinibius sp.]NIV10053.1 glycosyltransferase [Fodinibius sp.]NIY23632.1 glycosyltransferase [Fodinibius sp.]
MKSSQINKSKWVCSITHEYFPRDRRILRQAQALIERGYKVDILCIRNFSDHEKKEDRYGPIRIYRIPLSKKRGSKLRYYFEFLSAFILFSIKLNLLYFKKRYNVIQINNIPNGYVFIAVIPKLFGAKVFLDMHELMPELFLHRHNISTASLYYKILLLEEKLSVWFSDQVITVTEAISEVIKKRHKIESVTVVMNTADPFTVAERDEKIRDGLEAVFHGVLTNTYRMNVVIDAMEKLRDVLPVKFHIYGDGKTYSGLEAYIKSKNLVESVFLKGYLVEYKIAEMAHEFDLAIVPLDNNIYSQYAFASKISQYISMRIPILCSDVKCMRSYYDDDAILYFDLNDTDDLVEKIKYFNQHKAELGKTLVENACRQNEMITWNVMKEKYLSIFNL